MEVIVLGSGTSQGVPMIGCSCAVCTSPDPRNRRTRTSVHVVMDGFHVQVDAAPEFRLQCIQERVDKLDIFILTHGHTDHVAGMDDLRRFCDLRGGEGLPVYTTPEARARIAAIFPYAMVERALVRGYPAFHVKDMPALLELPQGTIQSTLLPHGDTMTIGLIFTERSSGSKFTYYTDCKRLTDEAVALARGSDAVIIDGLRPLPHPSHMSIDEAVEAGKGLGAKRVWLTHLTHLTEHAATEAALPAGFGLAYDGQRIRV
jgi:phosphoribosyl 1,2-cyclic phosphate phosphodiesterase